MNGRTFPPNPRKRGKSHHQTGRSDLLQCPLSMPQPRYCLAQSSILCIPLLSDTNDFKANRATCSSNTLMWAWLSTLIQWPPVLPSTHEQPYPVNEARGWITNSGSPCDSSTSLQDDIMLSLHKSMSCLASSEKPHLPHRFLSSSLKPWSYHSPWSCSSVQCLTPWKLAKAMQIHFFKLFYCTHAML